MGVFLVCVWLVLLLVFYCWLVRGSCHQSIAPIVAAARCFVSVLGMQRLQRIAGLDVMRVEAVGFKK
ncbi:MAG: hypothetical protein WCL14_00410 [Bacteroidota bacterium]